MLEELRRHWPPEAQLLLLKAALADLGTAQQAWREWRSGPDLADVSWAEVCLLAALSRRMPELAGDAPADPRVVGARRQIWTRSQITLAATRPMLASLRAEGIRLMLIKGAAMLSGKPDLIHDRAIRDVDAVVHPEDWERSISLAQREGWVSAKRDITVASLRRRHGVGLHNPKARARGEFDLHRYVLRTTMNTGQDSALWTRAQPVRFLGSDLFRPSPTDFALITLGQALLRGSASAPYWALDIDPMIRCGQIDWTLLIDEARQRRIEAYIAAPLLMLREQVDAPVPYAVLEALTRRMSKVALAEFAARASTYHPRTAEEANAWRIVSAARAMRMARQQADGRPDCRPVHAQALPSAVRHPRLAPNEIISIPVPTGYAPFARLRFYVSFDVQRARRNAHLCIEAPRLMLKVIPVARTGKRSGGRRHEAMISCPACLFDLRDIDHVRVYANDRLEVRNIVMGWERPNAPATLDRLTGTFRRWCEEIKRWSAAG